MFRLFNSCKFRFLIMFPVRFYNSLSAKFVYRPFVKFLVDFYKGEKINGVEIGVFKADFSLMLLYRLNIEKLFLIDPYFRYEGYTDDLGNENFLKVKTISHKKLKRFKNKMFIEDTSRNSVSSFNKESLDFVYIDGNHTYKYVKQDIKIWWDKVKKGGVLGGHDMNGGFIGVCRAVVEFCNKKGLILYGNKNEWWIIKK